MTSPSQSIDELAQAQVSVSYIGEFLMHNTISGYEAERHLAAVKLIKSMFDQLEQDIKAHPDYASRTAPATEQGV